MNFTVNQRTSSCKEGGVKKTKIMDAPEADVKQRYIHVINSLREKPPNISKPVPSLIRNVPEHMA